MVRSLYEKAFLRYFNFSHAPYQCMCDVIVAWCENTWILNPTFFRTKVTSESSLPSRLSRCNAKLLCWRLCQYHIILQGLVVSDSQRMETWQSAEMLQCVVKISSLFSQHELCLLASFMIQRDLGGEF